MVFLISPPPSPFPVLLSYAILVSSLITKFSPASCHFFPLASQYSPQNSSLSILNHPPSTALLHRDRTDCIRQITKLRFLRPELLDGRQENKTHHKVPSSHMLHNYTNYHTVYLLGGNDTSFSFYGSLAHFLAMASLSEIWKSILDGAY